MKNVTDMTTQELFFEWLACEREGGDPASPESARTALVRQVEIEREQDRRESMRADAFDVRDER